MAEAVGLIIKCDSVFQTSHLHNIWPQYVNAIELVEKNSNIFFGDLQMSHNDHTYTRNDITGFEHVLSKIGYLITSHLFQVICLENSIKITYQILSIYASLFFRIAI